MIKNVTCVVLAGGLSSRFGENKLLLPINNTTLMENTFNTIYNYNFTNVIVVLRNEAFIPIVKKYNFDYIINYTPQLGQGSSIKLALKKCNKNHAFLFCVADMPLLNKNTIDLIIKTSCNYPNKIIRPSFKNFKGNPVFFPNIYFEKLINISDKKGGISVANNSEEIHLLEIDNPNELKDIDTIDDYLKFIDKKINIISNINLLQKSEYEKMLTNNNYIVFYDEDNNNIFNNHNYKKYKIQKVSNVLDIFYNDFSKNLILIDKKTYDFLLSAKSDRIIYNL